MQSDHESSIPDANPGKLKVRRETEFDKVRVHILRRTQKFDVKSTKKFHESAFFSHCASTLPKL